MAEFAKPSNDNGPAQLPARPSAPATEIVSRDSAEAIAAEIFGHIVTSGFVGEAHRTIIVPAIAKDALMNLKTDERLLLCTWEGDSSGPIATVDGQAIGWLGHGNYGASDPEVRLDDQRVIGTYASMFDVKMNGEKLNCALIKLYRGELGIELSAGASRAEIAKEIVGHLAKRGELTAERLVRLEAEIENGRLYPFEEGNRLFLVTWHGRNDDKIGKIDGDRLLWFHNVDLYTSYGYGNPEGLFELLIGHRDGLGWKCGLVHLNRDRLVDAHRRAEVESANG